VHGGVFPAITGGSMPESIGALGIVESFSLATMLLAADAILKSAELEAVELRLGNGLGGKAFITFTGEVSAVQTGVAAAKAVKDKNGMFVNAEVIPAPASQLIKSLL
jgi:microcompartment protein CcmL/EutN